jgi:GNAT superfamily N-acetyltransferase
MIFRNINIDEDKVIFDDIRTLFSSDDATSTLHYENESHTENLFFVVEEDNGQILGAAEARIEEDHILKLLNFIIHSKYRKRGVGSGFLTAIETYTKEFLFSQVNKIKLIPGGDSRKFYENKGYEQDWLFLIKKL